MFSKNWWQWLEYTKDALIGKDASLYAKIWQCEYNFSGKIGERVLKSMVKDHAQQTQWRVNVFSSQCSDREYESTVYNHAYNDVKHILGAEKKIAANVDTISPLYRGQHLEHIHMGMCLDVTQSQFSGKINSEKNYGWL